MNWIPTSERLPDEGVAVLVCLNVDGYLYYDIAWLEEPHDLMWFRADDVTGAPLSRYSHWCAITPPEL